MEQNEPVVPLQSRFVEVEGVGNVEVRELLNDEAEELFGLEPKQLGKAIIKAALYLNGERIFAGKVGLRTATKLWALSDIVLEVNGMGKPDGLQTENE